VVVVFVSILIHELGHALTMRHYGDHQVYIALHGFGGFAQGSRILTRKQDIVVSAAGPFFQAAAAVAMWWIADLLPPQHRLVDYMMDAFIGVSLFWAAVNLLPIVPLDGGRISLAIFGPRREKAALILSLVIIGAVAVAMMTLTRGSIWNLILLALLAVNNVKRLRGERDGGLMGTP
jgi:Zn-dependent protease